jgi:glycosyltransferase involved in cell wall biosynthesis
MSDEQPLVTVLMPVFNGAPFLREALDSVFAQTMVDFELLVIDGGSTDGTLDLLRSVSDPRLRVISQRLNLIDSLNLGLTEARGKYIARMDADDIALPERLCTQIDFLQNNPHIALVGSNAYIIDEKGCVQSKTHRPVQSWWVNWNLFFMNPFVHSSVTVRKGVLFDGGLRYGQVPSTWRGFYTLPDYIECEDYLLWALISRKWPVCNLPVRLIKLREHRACKSQTNKKEVRMAARQVCSWNVSNFLEYHIPLDEWCSCQGPTERFIYSRFEHWLQKLEREFVKANGLSKRQEALLRQDVEFRLRIASGVGGGFIRRCITTASVVADTCLPQSRDYCSTGLLFVLAGGYSQGEPPPKVLQKISLKEPRV